MLLSMIIICFHVVVKSELLHFVINCIWVLMRSLKNMANFIVGFLKLILIL